MFRRLLLVVIGIAGSLVPAPTLRGEASPCGAQEARQFAEVPSSDQEAAAQLLGKEPWRVLKTAERQRFGSVHIKRWKNVVLAKAARGSATEKISATVCDGTLIVHNHDLCPDAKSSTLYLLVGVDASPDLYVFAWKSVGEGSCQ